MSKCKTEQLLASFSFADRCLNNNGYFYKCEHRDFAPGCSRCSDYDAKAAWDLPNFQSEYIL